MVREKVKEGAAWYIYNMQELIEELEGNARQQRRQVEVMGGACGSVFGYQSGMPRGRGVELGSSQATPLTAN